MEFMARGGPFAKVTGEDKGQSRPREESNLRTRFRKPLLYPLSYEGRELFDNGTHAIRAGHPVGEATPVAEGVAGGDGLSSPKSCWIRWRVTVRFPVSGDCSMTS